MEVSRWWGLTTILPFCPAKACTPRLPVGSPILALAASLLASIIPDDAGEGLEGQARVRLRVRHARMRDFVLQPPGIQGSGFRACTARTSASGKRGISLGPWAWDCRTNTDNTLHKRHTLASHVTMHEGWCCLSTSLSTTKGLREINADRAAGCTAGSGA